MQENDFGGDRHWGQSHQGAGRAGEGRKTGYDQNENVHANAAHTPRGDAKGTGVIDANALQMKEKRERAVEIRQDACEARDGWASTEGKAWYHHG
jgi:hypothetical protein